MKYATFLIALCLIGLLPQQSKAGFVCIDDFTDPMTPDGVADTRTFVGVPTAPTIMNSQLSGSGEGLVFISFGFDSPYDFSMTPVFELSGVSFGPSGSPQVTEVTAIAQLNSGTSVIASSSVPTTGTNIYFDFTGAIELASVNSLIFALTPSPSRSLFSFSIDKVQAVPEPATLVLLGTMGIAGTVFYRRKRRGAEALAA